MASTPTIHPRESIYYLSILATVLQKCNLSVYDILNPDGDSFTIVKSRTRPLNHLATCLSRGGNNKITAATAGPLEPNGLSILLYTRSCLPDTTSADVSSSKNPCCSSGSSIGDDSSLSSSAELDEKTTVDESGTIISPKTDDKNEGRNHYLFTIPAVPTVSPVPILDTLLSLGATCRREDIPSRDFGAFAHESLALLRAATLRIRWGTPEDAAKTQAAVCAYFIGSCRVAFRARLDTLGECYLNHPDFKTWVPTESEQQRVYTQRVKVHHAGARHALSLEDIPSDEQGFRFSGDNVAAWWRALVVLLVLLHKSLESDNLYSTYTWSNAVHMFVQAVPPLLWKMSSLDDHLERCRTGGRNKTAEEDGKVEADVKEDKSNEEEEMVDISTPDKPLPTTAYSDCILFHRAVDAACAWTTAPINLLGTHIAKCSIPLHVAVLGHPCRRPVEPVPIERLIKHWSATSHWSEETQNQATEHLRKFDDAGHDALQAPDAQCHSEAGLIASIVRLHPEPKVFPRDSVADAEYAIGIPRKCCPVCRILAEIVIANYNLNLELPGRHNRYRPWVPPHWLPDVILEKLEAALQRRVTDMLAPPKRTSRGDFKFNMNITDIAELLQDLGDLDDIEV